MKQKSIVTIVVGLLAVAAYFLKLTVFNQPVTNGKKELLVYCGITMIQPMSEIASVIERQEGHGKPYDLSPDRMFG